MHEEGAVACWRMWAFVVGGSSRFSAEMEVGQNFKEARSFP